MTLHSELAAGPTGCKVCTYVAGLPAGQAAEWQAELKLPVKVIGNTSVVLALKRRGIHIEEASVRRHRTNHVAR